ncbi:DUF3040 domain-containing protein [Actinophytocola algeriensis]|uniref:DUF3040 domain-containing protein n=1 Tax=Actinophytocola algeriensis TaxID=1768010 RepID=A0A7W7QAL2_9PSEU|nr:DUF3040 domain-containing protein [Actinophytocola algeriensis]MBB4910131.1 hypothetical protein [Actinophytocola algeriensis]MBE1480881.1 hypothetical protein [Actinophytocola algeriensis]
MLSHDEDRHLQEIERWFEESDPAFTRMLRDHRPPQHDRLQSAGRVAVDIVGVLMFVVGAVAASAVLMVFAILVLGVAGCLHLAAHA